MKLYPAIDVLEGRVVRLAKGDFAAVTDYGGDPAAVARSYLEAGAEWLHLVDLSGARDGRRRQLSLVESVAATGIKVQTGGGVRTGQDIESLLASGASRVVIGSLAVTDPGKVSGWLVRYGAEAIAAAFDVRMKGDIPVPVVKGWTEEAGITLGELLQAYQRHGLRHALATDTGRDGMLEGINTALYQNLVTARPEIAWQASGGVASLEDIRQAKALKMGGVIIGRALFEGRFTLEEALAC
ncbi:1-(5-phosphoribosyl)-5-[(5-phosphoribosylamino)methylideneamino] imidazole-4-carboxamide isomerase [Synechococcus moorigangaii CMS01]|nr:1-(5-phosphoribosyl)-5-[(5-phosphoribosylamino)methylideneamino] imidazole-4-carboxamide isomerase [Synechococcus moorigangaii CMS01]